MGPLLAAFFSSLNIIGWMVELQLERVLCRDYSLDRHYHGQVEELAANHHRHCEWTWRW
jgi:hypothetical protein